MKLNLLATFALAFAAGLISARAQINTGSDGHDGAFNPTQSTVIDMADHPDGIYQYTSVNIPSGVTVSFKPNANNTPVVWLVQGSCVINGTVDVRGFRAEGDTGGAGGPGGYAGGQGRFKLYRGGGPGGGSGSTSGNAGNGSYGSVGLLNGTASAGAVYGNDFLLPLIGGSGGGGVGNDSLGVGGGGAGGAILIAAPNQILINGRIWALGASGEAGSTSGTSGTLSFSTGGGSGGAVRLLATSIAGTGEIIASGGIGGGAGTSNRAGNGRIRFDAIQVSFGKITGTFTQGFQPIIMPGQSQGVSLSIASIAGLGTPGNPKGQVNTPDVVVPAVTANPVPVVVQCANIPLNTPVTVFAIPTMGSQVQANAVNNAGTLTSSTATINLNLPRGGGIIYASAVVGIGGLGAAADGGGKAASYAQTGLTADGERFTKLEITAALGSAPQTAYITESGKKYALPAQ